MRPLFLSLLFFLPSVMPGQAPAEAAPPTGLGRCETWARQFETIKVEVKSTRPWGKMRARTWNGMRTMAGNSMLHVSWQEVGGIVQLGSMIITSPDRETKPEHQELLGAPGFLVAGDAGLEELQTWIKANIAKGGETTLHGTRYKLTRNPARPGAVTLRFGPPDPDPETGFFKAP